MDSSNWKPLNDNENIYDINNSLFLKKSLSQLLEEFEEEKGYHWYALTIILRNIYEQEGMLSNEIDIKKTIWHSLLHPGGIKTDFETFVTTILELFHKLPKEYDNFKKNLIKKISNYKVFENPIFSICGLPSQPKTKITHNLKIKKYRFFCFYKNEAYYIYWGKNNKDNVYSFISKKYLAVNSIYDLEFWLYKYTKIFENELEDIFFEVRSENLTKQKQQKILDEINAENEIDLIKMASNEIIEYDNENTTFENLNYLLNYYNEDFSKIIKEKKDFYPFSLNPFLFNLPGKKIPKKIINEIVQEIEFKKPDFKKLKETLLLEAKIKKQLIINESFFIEMGEYKETELKKINSKVFECDYQNKKIYWKEHKIIVDSFNEILKQDNDDNGLYFIENEDSGEFKNNKIIKKTINSVKQNKITFLLGPAGFGKTTAIQQIIKKYKKNQKKVLVSCPTNKALSLYSGIADESELKSVFWLNSETSKEEIKDFDLIIIDELSMVNDWGFFKNKSVFEGTKILISGDDKQLPPIQNNFRFYLWFQNEINEKHIINLSSKKNENFRLNSQANKRIFSMMDSIRQHHFKWKSSRKYNVFVSDSKIRIFKKLKEFINDGYKIITSNNYGFFGVNFLNRTFSKKNNGIFSEGDEIIFTDNDQRKKYYNNVLGIIEKINGLEYKVKNLSTKKTFSIKDKGSKYDNDLPFSHAKAITAHKSQGSSFPKIVVLITGNEITYEWLYTAYSRAKKDVIILITNNFNEIISWKKQVGQKHYENKI